MKRNEMICNQRKQEEQECKRDKETEQNHLWELYTALNIRKITGNQLAIKDIHNS